ncbi:MAG: ribosome maturation factor RimP [Endozoicomonadaceae bacterium]|nr:ribosome maturation factor RimP [Endozoicomonadaceae bacterium]
MVSKLEVLHELIEPVVKGQNCSFWGVEFLMQGHHSLLRVYIDAEQGVTVDDCTKVSRQLSAVMDVADPIREEYTLEVSSPGLDRPLFTLAQYEGHTGQIVNIQLRLPFEGRRKFKGVIKGVEGEEIVLMCEEYEFLFPVDTIEKARVVPQS